MTEAELFAQTEGAYLRLIHPILAGERYREDLAPVLALAPSVPEALVGSLLVGASWRERLLGLCLGMAKRPATWGTQPLGQPTDTRAACPTSQPPAFVESILQSLREPRGIAIVPACAVLGVLAQRGVYAMHPSLAYEFDRAVFDGEIGWAVDKALDYVGLPAAAAHGQGPNYGQVFEDHAAVYAWVHDRAGS